MNWHPKSPRDEFEEQEPHVGHIQRVEAVAPGSFSLMMKVGAAWAVITFAASWMGGVAQSPGARAVQAEQAISSELKEHKTDNDSTLRNLRLSIDGLKVGQNITLTLLCTPAEVLRLRRNQQYPAAARCQEIIETGQ